MLRARSAHSARNRTRKYWVPDSRGCLIAEGAVHTAYAGMSRRDCHDRHAFPRIHVRLKEPTFSPAPTCWRENAALCACVHACRQHLRQLHSKPAPAAPEPARHLLVPQRAHPAKRPPPAAALADGGALAQQPARHPRQPHAGAHAPPAVVPTPQQLCAQHPWPTPKAPVCPQWTAQHPTRPTPQCQPAPGTPSPSSPGPGLRPCPAWQPSAGCVPEPATCRRRTPGPLVCPCAATWSSCCVREQSAAAPS